MEQFLSVNLVSIIQLIAFVGGGIWIVSSMKVRLESIEKELYQLRNVVVDLARQGERLNAMDQRMLTQGKRIDRMADHLFRHGREVKEDGET